MLINNLQYWVWTIGVLRHEHLHNGEEIATEKWRFSHSTTTKPFSISSLQDHQEYILDKLKGGKDYGAACLFCVEIDISNKNSSVLHEQFFNYPPKPLRVLNKEVS